jgi:hypothetical protein
MGLIAEGIAGEALAPWRGGILSAYEQHSYLGIVMQQFI